MTIQTLRPDGTYSQTTGISGVGGGTTVHGSTSDNNDATGVAATAPNSRAIVTLTGYTLLAGQRVKQARPRLRCFRDPTDVGWNESVQVRFRNSTATRSGNYSLLGSSSGGSAIADRSGAYESTAPGKYQWYQSEINGLMLEVAWTQSSPNSWLRLVELYVELDINERPVVSGVTATGFTGSTRPTLSATYTDTENDPQTRGEWYVYPSSITVPDPGVTPGYVWASGKVLGAGTTITIGTDLINGASYKAYFRAAQYWPGPDDNNSHLWWSAWASSSTFTIQLTPPVTPTLAVTTEQTLPDYRVQLSVRVPLNLLSAQQASLEDGTVTGWLAQSNCTLASSTAWFADGGRSLQLTSVAAGNMYTINNYLALPDIQVTAGERYVAVCKVRSVAVARSVQMEIRWMDATGGVFAIVIGTVAVSATGADTDVYGSWVAPTRAVRAIVQMTVLATAGAGEQHRFDRVGFFSYPVDPGSAAAAANLWSPGGMINSSVVIERAERVSPTITRGPAPGWIHPQLFTGGGLTQNPDGFYVRQATDRMRTVRLDTASPEGPEGFTTGMLEWTVATQSASNFLDIGAPAGVAQDGQNPYALWAQAGSQFTFSVWLKARASFPFRLILQFCDEFNNAVGSAINSASLLATTTAQKFSVVGTCPAGAVNARVSIENSGGTGTVGSVVYVIMPMWEMTGAPKANLAWPGQAFSFEWKQVRTLQLSGWFDNGASELIVHDYEYPGGRPCLYRARVVATVSGAPISSWPSAQVAVYMPPPGKTLLFDPFQPENKMVIKRDGRSSESQSEDVGIFHPYLAVDKAQPPYGGPIAVSDFIGGQDGSLLIGYEDELELYKLRQLLPSRRALAVQWHDGGLMYIRISGDRPTERRSAEWGYVNVDYLETARP